jgi:hypothetical protein
VHTSSRNSSAHLDTGTVNGLNTTSADGQAASTGSPVNSAAAGRRSREDAQRGVKISEGRQLSVSQLRHSEQAERLDLWFLIADS